MKNILSINKYLPLIKSNTIHQKKPASHKNNTVHQQIPTTHEKQEATSRKHEEASNFFCPPGTEKVPLSTEKVPRSQKVP